MEACFKSCLLCPLAPAAFERAARRANAHLAKMLGMPFVAFPAVLWCVPTPPPRVCRISSPMNADCGSCGPAGPRARAPGRAHPRCLAVANRRRLRSNCPGPEELRRCPSRTLACPRRCHGGGHRLSPADWGGAAAGGAGARAVRDGSASAAVGRTRGSGASQGGAWALPPCRCHSVASPCERGGCQQTLRVGSPSLRKQRLSTSERRQPTSAR